MEMNKTTKTPPKLYIFAETPAGGLELEQISAHIYENGLELLDSKGRPARFFPFGNDLGHRILYGDVIFAVMTMQGELRPLDLHNSPTELAQYFEPLEQKRAAQQLASQVASLGENIARGIELLQSAKIGGMTSEMAASIEAIEAQISNAQAHNLFPNIIPQRVFHVSFGGGPADNPPMTLRAEWPNTKQKFLTYFDGGAEKCCISPALAKRRKMSPSGRVVIEGIEGVRNEYDVVEFPLIVENVPLLLEAAVHPNTSNTGFELLLDRQTYLEAQKRGANITLN